MFCKIISHLQLLFFLSFVWNTCLHCLQCWVENVPSYLDIVTQCTLNLAHTPHDTRLAKLAFESLTWLVGDWLVIQMAFSWPNFHSLFCLMHWQCLTLHPLCARVPCVADNALRVGRFGSSLSAIQWFSPVLSKTVCMRLWAHGGQWVTSSLFHSLLCGSSLPISVFMAQCAFPVRSKHFWPPFPYVLFPGILVFLFAVPSPLLPSPLISLSFSSILHLSPCLFTPTLFPAVISAFFVFCAFWSSFIWAVDMVGWQRHRHILHVETQ